jgi:hypothetical protein
MELKSSRRFVSMHFIVSLVPFSIIVVLCSMQALNLNLFYDCVDEIVDGTLAIVSLLFVALSITFIYIIQLLIDPPLRQWKLPLITLLLQIFSLIMLFCYLIDISSFIG